MKWLAILFLLVVGCDRGSTIAAPGPGPERSPAEKLPFPSEPAAATGHPRLFLRATDLPRLRSWAVPTNPIFKDGIGALGEAAKEDMDKGNIPNSGDCTHRGRFCESYAELFAFLSLVSPNATERADYAARAKTVLMTMIRRAASLTPGDVFSDPKDRFSVYNRSRWVGEAFPLVVDWIYPSFTPPEKALIRSVFLKWAEEQLHARVTGYETKNHPDPVGVLADPILVRKKEIVRFAGNNYFCAHMRNLGLMAMALDAEDDPSEPRAKRTYPRLRDYLTNAVGAWMYMQDHLFRTEALGGSAPEGLEYGPETLAAVMQLHLALQTAGEEDVAKHGRQVLVAGHPFWRDALAAYAHAMSPATVTRETWQGPEFEPAWVGDGENYSILDFISFFGPFGVHAAATGDTARLDATRFVQTHLAPGTVSMMKRRASAYGGGLAYLQAIWYFLLFDPNAPAPPDFRKTLPLEHFGAGLGQLFARTSWAPEASWFQFQIGWQTIDHRHGDANSFGFYRRGEWLTKERLGYGHHFENSDQHNTLTIENDRPNHANDYRIGSYWKRGSQWVIAADDGRLLAHTFGKDFAYALGDATGFYNSSYEASRDVRHASRSIVWMKPDHVVVYDRATTGKPNRFKRFWLHTPAKGAVSGDLTTVTTKSGQRLFVRTLLPVGARIATEVHRVEGLEQRPAANEPMTAFLRVEAPLGPADARFLHVLQGADAGQPVDAVQVVRSANGVAFIGVAVKDFAVLFPENLDVPLSGTTFTVPAGVKRVLVTGVRPGASYDAESKPSPGGTEWMVRPGKARRADEGGVLAL